jgi:hypothetical protein
MKLVRALQQAPAVAEFSNANSALCEMRRTVLVVTSRIANRA